MPTFLRLRFPLGRYHATPWGQNVNEGGVEWPPSPWRITRALYATWRTRCRQLDPETVVGLLDALAEPPTYYLPAYALGHTRHFVPNPGLSNGQIKPTKLIDAFVAVSPKAEVVARWEVGLSDGHREALVALASQLTYLGRAESICDAEVVDDVDVTGLAPCAPLKQPAREPVGGSVALLAPQRPVVEAELTVTTGYLRTVLRRVDPPGAERVLYRVERASREASSQAVRHVGRMTAMRWSVASAALPNRFRAVALADALRRAALARNGGPEKDPSPWYLTGKADDGTKLASEDQHQHAHWFGVGLHDEQRIDTLVLWVPHGIPDDDEGHRVAERIAGIRHLRWYDEGNNQMVALALEGWGLLHETVPELAGPSLVWRSVTPFSPGRFYRRTTFDERVERSVLEELRWRGIEQVPLIERIPGPWLRYRTYRLAETRDLHRRAAGLQLTFEEPIHGPLALGALSHFGLGLFMPVV